MNMWAIYVYNGGDRSAWRVTQTAGYELINTSFYRPLTPDIRPQTESPLLYLYRQEPPPHAGMFGEQIG